MAVWEITQLAVAEDAHDEFESVVRSHLPALREADGCLDVKLLRAVDREGILVLCILWESIEHHTDVFMKTETFTKFSSAVTPFLMASPVVFHATTVIDGFEQAVQSVRQGIQDNSPAGE
jgi:quinol monooxygenase YgiN